MRATSATADVEALREMLLDGQGRAHLFPGLDTVLRSRPTSKAIRLAIGPGVARMAIEPRSGGRARVAIQHQGLAREADVDVWKAHWAEWLSALDDA